MYESQEKSAPKLEQKKQSSSRATETLKDNRSQAVRQNKLQSMADQYVSNMPDPTTGAQPADLKSSSVTNLPLQLKAGLEHLGGVNLSGVQVNYNSSEPAKIDAKAYAEGNTINVSPGEEKHLPHEGWHVVQQMQGRVKPTVQAKGLSINDDPQLEHEADVMGAKAMQLGKQGIADDSAASLSNSQGHGETKQLKGKAVIQAEHGDIIEMIMTVLGVGSAIAMGIYYTLPRILVQGLAAGAAWAAPLLIRYYRSSSSSSKKSESEDESSKTNESESETPPKEIGDKPKLVLRLYSPNSEHPDAPGEVTHVTNSCYAASILNLIANSTNYRRLFDPARNVLGADSNGRRLQDVVSPLVLLIHGGNTLSGEQVTGLLRLLAQLGLLQSVEEDIPLIEQQQDAARVLMGMLPLVMPADPSDFSTRTRTHRVYDDEQEDRVDNENENVLQLGTRGNRTLEQGLVNYFNSYAMRDPEVNDPHQVSRRGSNFPAVLTIHVVRESRHSRIDMPGAFTIPRSITQDGRVGPRYRLRGFVVHRSSHYVSYLRRTEQWFRSDDIGPSVSPVNISNHQEPGMSGPAFAQGMLYTYERVDDYEGTENRLTLGEAHPRVVRRNGYTVYVPKGKTLKESDDSQSSTSNKRVVRRNGYTIFVPSGKKLNESTGASRSPSTGRAVRFDGFTMYPPTNPPTKEERSKKPSLPKVSPNIKTLKDILPQEDTSVHGHSSSKPGPSGSTMNQGPQTATMTITKSPSELEQPKTKSSGTNTGFQDPDPSPSQTVTLEDEVPKSGLTAKAKTEQTPKTSEDTTTQVETPDVETRRRLFLEAYDKRQQQNKTEEVEPEVQVDSETNEQQAKPVVVSSEPSVVEEESSVVKDTQPKTVEPEQSTVDSEPKVVVDEQTSAKTTVEEDSVVNPPVEENTVDPVVAERERLRKERRRLERLAEKERIRQRQHNAQDALGTVEYYIHLVQTMMYSGALTDEDFEALQKIMDKLREVQASVLNKSDGIAKESVQQIKDYITRIATKALAKVIKTQAASQRTGGTDGVWTGNISDVLLTQWILEHENHGMAASNAAQVARGIVSHNGTTSGGGTRFRYNGHTVFHISHGKNGRTDGCTVFFIVTKEGVTIVGIGAHAGSSSYKLDWKLSGWCEGTTISL
ncbi:hypothetical protein [Pleionea sp. CnH1-48]|uniref:hypothetical protein n=1 Tax=Pleionea sp. CnH1-48 TaxID=2954494 RepID=UPI00209816A4|nr:hypothetical protein [Pleionea sp. CnH1-48]MCO7223387.1 hypothetical protein [Pleionea sp. CnH1-48]